MRYSLLLNFDESGFTQMTPEDIATMNASYGEYLAALGEAGVLVAADYLQPSAVSTTVTLRTGELQVQDGPFADTKEQLGGLFILDVADLDAAIAWAAKCPVARFGIIEIRPSALP
jgi:hypothetical protein